MAGRYSQIEFLFLVKNLYAGKAYTTFENKNLFQPPLVAYMNLEEQFNRDILPLVKDDRLFMNSLPYRKRQYESDPERFTKIVTEFYTNPDNKGISLILL